VEARENFRGKVKAGSRSSDRSSFASIDGLVAVAVGGGIIASNVGRQWDVADLFNKREEIGEVLPGFAGPDRRGRLSPHKCRGEANVAFAELSAGGHLSLEFVIIAKEEMLTDSDLSAWTDEALPVVWILLQLSRQQDFHAAAKEIARRRVLRTEGLRLKACAAAIEAGGKHARVVKDDQIVGPE
jgi:hypothetical protein